MGAIAALEPSVLQVEPGGSVSAVLRVRNAGQVVDEFTFEVVGAAGGWTSVEPSVLRLLPGVEEQVAVTLAPPRGASVAAGEIPFGVRVVSKEDPAGSVVEEGTVTVGGFAEVAAELVPHTSQGRRSGRHELAVDNRGNERLNTDVLAYDKDELLEFDVGEPGLVLEPGTASFTQVVVRPRKRFWRGPNKTVPFTVELHAADREQPVAVVDGTLVQRAVVPKWLVWLLLGLVGLVLLAALLWWTLLKPTIESAARESVEEAVEEAVDAAVAAAVEDAVAAGVGAEVAGLGEDLDVQRGALNDLLEQFDEFPPLEDRPAPGVESLADDRLAVTAAPGASGTDSFVLGEGETFALSDIVLQNPGGHVGRLEIRRNTQTLLVAALQNFRDLDYHFVSPVHFTDQDTLVLVVICDPENDTPCDIGAYVTGTLTSPPTNE